jgi:hypothetical protein
MKKTIMFIILFMLLVNGIFTASSKGSENKKNTSRLVVEDWFGFYHHGQGTPYILNKNINIFMNDLQIGYNLLKDREKFFGPFFRNRITYEPKKDLPWFNIVENAIGLKWRPGSFQLGVEIASLRYLGSAQFENIGGNGWDLLEKDQSEYTAFRAFASFWDDWNKKDFFYGEHWAQIYYHGPGTKDINKNNIIGMGNTEVGLNFLRAMKKNNQFNLRFQIIALGNAAYDTKRFPWNNFYEGGFGLQTRYKGFRLGICHIWGDFHGNAQFENIGGKGWDVAIEERGPYKTWRVYLTLWLSLKRDR